VNCNPCDRLSRETTLALLTQSFKVVAQHLHDDRMVVFLPAHVMDGRKPLASIDVLQNRPFRFLVSLMLQLDGDSSVRAHSLALVDVPKCTTPDFASKFPFPRNDVPSDGMRIRHLVLTSLDDGQLNRRAGI